MENILTNLFLKTLTTQTKDSSGQEKMTGQEGLLSALDFSSMLSSKMGACVAPSGQIGQGAAEVAQGTIAGEIGTATVQEELETSGGTAVDCPKGDNEGRVSAQLSTQSVIALLQMLLQKITPEEPESTAVVASDDVSDGAAITDDLKPVLESFLKGILDFLQEGESAEFTRMTTESLTSTGSDTLETNETPETNSADGNNATSDLKDTESANVAKAVTEDPAQADRNGELISYLLSVLNQASPARLSMKGEENGEKTVGSSGGDSLAGKLNEGTDHNNAAQKVAEHKSTFNDNVIRMDKKVPVPQELLLTDSADKDALSNAAGDVRVYQKLEVKRIDGKEHVYRVLSSGSTPAQGDGAGKEISVLTVKVERPVSSGDDEATKLVSKVSEQSEKSLGDKDERQLLPQNDFVRAASHLEKEGVRGVERSSFGSVMADRIEKIVEQYAANRSGSMDMVLRLRIDDKETLLVGLKDQGHSITVEVKTTNESVGNYLISQKEDMARQLEGKNVYTNIYVDVQNEGSEKKEQKEQRKETAEEGDIADFGGLIEAMA